jgi:hypothetical protein
VITAASGSKALYCPLLILENSPGTNGMARSREGIELQKFCD